MNPPLRADHSRPIPAASKPFYRILYVQVLFAIAMGVLVGVLFPTYKDETGTVVMGLGEKLQPLGDGFIKLVKMIIAPVIFCTVVSGIAGMQDMKKMGRVGGKALLYFEVVSTFALVIGLIVVNVIQPGAGFTSDAKVDAATLDKFQTQAKEQSTVTFILNIIPKTIVSAFSEGDILQVLLVAILFGVALSHLGAVGRVIKELIDRLAEVIFRIVGMLMRLAPIGAFGAMAYTIGKYGLKSLVPLAWLMGSFYLTCILFIFVVLGVIAWWTGFSIVKFIRYIKEELLLVLGTSSSESALPGLIEKMERAGCGKSVVGLVVPTGYSFNLDGTNIYMTMAALFVAQSLNISLTISQQVTILLVAMLTSKGASGVTGAGFITLAATLQAIHDPVIPIIGMAPLLGIDRFMSEARALTNFIGNGVATVVVARWENDLDTAKLQAAMDGRTETDVSVEPAV